MSNPINKVTALYEQAERLIYSSLVSALLSNDLDIKEGKLNFNATNTGFINAMFRSLDAEMKPEVQKIATEIIEAIQEALQSDVNKYTQIDVRAIEISKPIINRIRKHSTLNVNSNLLFAPLYNKVKSRMISMLSKIGGISLQELRDALNKLVINQHLVNGYYERWTYDIYNQYRRAGNNELRKAIGLRYAVFEGGTIETTRDWCNKWAGKVLHEDEIKAWSEQEWQGKPTDGYDPFIDAGGFNCRHRWRWITDGLAAILLKEQNKDIVIDVPEPTELDQLIDTVVIKVVEPKAIPEQPQPTISLNPNPDKEIKVEKAKAIQEGETAKSVDAKDVKYIEIAGNYISENVNTFKLKHFTKDESIVEAIKKDGFKAGANSVFGEGVYFTSDNIISSAYKASLEVTLQPHKQLYIQDDYNTYSIVSKATGKPISNGFQIKDALLDAGYGSVRIRQEDESIWTLVLDPKLIILE